jgi:1-acyl-sn-glycerol-3-phosphate acyltransferase
MIATLRRRVAGTYEVDPWGLDLEVVEALSPLAGLRWGIEVDCAERLPAEGPALVVANRRFGLSEPFVVARGLRLATGRPVRFAGAPDVSPVGPVLRRLGAVLGRPDEIAGLLRAGAIVGVPCAPVPRPGRHVGAVPVDLVAPAVELGVPVVPVALLGRELGRQWRVRVGRPVPRPATVGPLAVAELADAARAELRRLLLEAH